MHTVSSLQCDFAGFGLVFFFFFFSSLSSRLPPLTAFLVMVLTHPASLMRVYLAPPPSRATSHESLVQNPKRGSLSSHTRSSQVTVSTKTGLPSGRVPHTGPVRQEQGSHGTERAAWAAGALHWPVLLGRGHRGVWCDRYACLGGVQQWSPGRSRRGSVSLSPCWIPALAVPSQPLGEGHEH